MTSAAQLDANRRNAQKSTGPKSEAGKKRSSGNAFLHGLTAKRVLLPGEDPKFFESLWDEACGYFEPEGCELVIVRDWCELIWRLRRVPVWEEVIFNSKYNALYGGKYWTEHPGNEERRMGYVLENLLKESDVLSKIHRYEAGLHKQLVSKTRLLLDLRKARTAMLFSMARATKRTTQRSRSRGVEQLM
jgi:hypothetical protein